MIKNYTIFLLIYLFSVSGCSLGIVKKRLAAPHDIGSGILFQFDAPSARQVNLAGDFPDNEWLKHGDQIDMMNDNGENGDKVAGDGIWSILKQLSSGRYEYKFVVDRNTWVIDPNAMDTSDDGYGGKNSVLIVK